MVKNVYSTNYSGSNISRFVLLDWINNYLEGSTRYQKIEQLANGVAHCQIMEKLFPGSVAINRLKVQPVSEHEYIQNFKLLQAAFTKMRVDKVIPVERLVKARFQDNLEFAQWIWKFYTANTETESDNSDNVLKSPPKAKQNIKETKEPEVPMPINLHTQRGATKIIDYMGRSDQKVKQKLTNDDSKIEAIAGEDEDDEDDAMGLSSNDTTDAASYNISDCEQFESKPKGDDKSTEEKDLNRIIKCCELKKSINDISRKIEDVCVVTEHIMDEKNYYFEKLLKLEMLCLETDKEKNNPIIQMLLQQINDTDHKK